MKVIEMSAKLAAGKDPKKGTEALTYETAGSTLSDPVRGGA
jgi:hypothetical protein